MDWAGLFKNPQSWLFVVVLMLLGVEVFPKLPGTTTKNELAEGQEALLEELRTYKEKERDDNLRDALLSEVKKIVSDAVKESTDPISDQLKQIESDLQRGNRWALEDQVELWKAEGSDPATDPRVIQSQRLADEYRKRQSGPVVR